MVKGEGDGAGTSLDTGGPTDALVAPQRGVSTSDSSENENDSYPNNVLTTAAAVPLPQPLPKRAKARIRRSANSKPCIKNYVKQVIVEFCCGEESHMGN
eukprot:6231475-Heterocapsa_arctica.AAC.1